MSLDVAAIRAQFPSLESGIAYFDGPGGTQTPSRVGEAIARTITAPLSNRGTVTAGSGMPRTAWTRSGRRSAT